MEININENFKASESISSIEYSSTIRLWIAMFIAIPVTQVLILITLLFAWVFMLFWFGLSGITSVFSYRTAWEMIKVPYCIVTAEKIKND